MRDLNMYCIDCDVDTDTINEFYMVHDKLWKAAVPHRGDRNNRVLCIGCLEIRIGRQLCASDFTDARVNNDSKHQSERLRSRLTTTT